MKLDDSLIVKLLTSWKLLMQTLIKIKIGSFLNMYLTRIPITVDPHFRVTKIKPTMCADPNR